MTDSLAQKSLKLNQKHWDIINTSGSNLLGCIIKNNNLIFDFDLKEEMFVGNNSLIFLIIKEFISAKIKFNESAVAQELISKERKDLCTYPFTLTENVTTTANSNYFYETLLTSFNFEKSRNLFLESYNELLTTEDSLQTLSSFTEKLTRLQEKATQKDFKTTKELVPQSMKEIEKAYTNKDPFIGIKTGIKTIDAYTLGLCKQTFYVIGARPSHGKTALALSIAVNMALRGVRVGFISVESPANQLIKRAKSIVSNIELTKLRSGMLNVSDFEMLGTASSKLYDAPLYIWDYPITIPKLIMRSRLLKKKFNVDIIFLDYLGSKIKKTQQDSRETHEFIGQQSSACADLAKELDIPFVALSQLGRDSEGQKPKTRDMFGSSQIEKDADVIMALWHKNGLSNNPSHTPDSKICFLKNRDGSVGDADIFFKQNCVRFEDRAKIPKE